MASEWLPIFALKLTSTVCLLADKLYNSLVKTLHVNRPSLTLTDAMKFNCLHFVKCFPWTNPLTWENGALCGSPCCCWTYYKGQGFPFVPLYYTATISFNLMNYSDRNSACYHDLNATQFAHKAFFSMNWHINNKTLADCKLSSTLYLYVCVTDTCYLSC